MAHDKKDKSGFVRDMEIAAGDLYGKIKETVRKGNTKRVIISKEKGEKLIEMPLTIGVIAGCVAILFVPAIAAIAAIAGLVARVRLEIIKPDIEEKK